MQNMSKKWF